MENKEHKEHKGNVKENAIRVMCFLLGVLLTTGAVLVKDRAAGLLVNWRPSKAQEVPVPAEPEEPTETAEVTPEADILEQKARIEEEESLMAAEKFEAEAEEKFEELKAAKAEAAKAEAAKAEAAKEEASSEAEAPAEKDTFMIDGKVSKLNWDTSYPALAEENDLEWHAARKTSYEETMTANALDKKIIEDCDIDFSDVKIAILGDSITAATNLSEEDQKMYNYPKLLGEILGCEVENYGIGGSVVSRCASNYPMVDRWQELPCEADIVIVMGGTNDALFENKWQFGNVEYDLRMNSGTFCGDLDEMVSGMKWKFVDEIEDRYVKLIYINPMCTILNDGVYATDPGNMVEQRTFAEAINEIVPPYGFDIIDLYNQNFLNSHDPQVNAEYITDGVHPNPEGYRILAEHIAAEIIRRIN